MMKLRPFELALVSFFGVLIFLALYLMSSTEQASNSNVNQYGASVVIWGTQPREAFEAVFKPLREENINFQVVTYVEKDARTFDTQLINALAENRGPDVLFLPHEKLLQYRSKLQALPDQTLPIPSYKRDYIDGADIFILSDGIYAFPATVDPLVMYFNRDLLSSKNFISPPTTWESIVNDIVPSLVERDFGRNIIRSPLAFGEYRNVTNAFDVLSMLLLQGGSSLVVQPGKNYRIELNQAVNGTGLPLENALTFYTNFASPSNPLYSWNRAQQNDRDEFLGEGLVLYFGKGSEANEIASLNPNLNFDIAEVPQGAGATIRRTYGTMYGFVLMKSSVNPTGSIQAMRDLTSARNSVALANNLTMAPVSRSGLSQGSNDRYGRIIYSTSPVARGWLSPDPTKANDIFTQMVEDVLANRARPSDAANDAVGRLRDVY
jgi:ABC-type glycerol-3-phosphate transport system substrate-binding protein